MFIGTKAERERLQAKERYWHDQASRVYEFEEEIRAREAVIRSQDEKLRSQNEELRSQDEKLRSQNEELRSQDEKLRSQNEELRSQDEKLRSIKRWKLAAERKVIAKTLFFRFNKPVATSLALLNEIDSSETLNRLSDVSDECENYDDFLKKLADCNAET